jgi:hypothetical protein
VARPGGSELGEDFELPSQGVADHEGFARLGRVGRVGPEVYEPERGCDGVWGPEGEEVEGQSEPSILVRIEHVEGGRGGSVAMVVVVVVVVRWAESEEGGWWSGGNEVCEVR